MGKHLTLVAVIGFYLAGSAAAHAQVSPGDMNCDGVVDGLDIPLFVDCVVNGNCERCGVMIETVPVGNEGNANDTEGDGYGGVNYAYNIGKYEVTAGQYTAFLNAVARTDPYGLYNPNMDVAQEGCQITQHGCDGCYWYDFSGGTVEVPESTATDWASRPVNYVSWGDAARFSNWLHNGQPTGMLTGDPLQDAGMTEDGSYFLNGATSNEDLLLVTRKANATWVIPTEDEWYKSAYHKNDGVTGNYWDYPMGSDEVPNNGNPGGDTGNSANFYDGNYAIGGPYWRTNVGCFALSPSPYGTFDQAGNLWEWNEAIPLGTTRGLRGGSLGTSATYLHTENRLYPHEPPPDEWERIGFRVVQIP